MQCIQRFDAQSRTSGHEAFDIGEHSGNPINDREIPQILNMHERLFEPRSLGSIDQQSLDFRFARIVAQRDFSRYDRPRRAYDFNRIRHKIQIRQGRQISILRLNLRMKKPPTGDSPEMLPHSDEVARSERPNRSNHETAHRVGNERRRRKGNYTSQHDAQ